MIGGMENRIKAMRERAGLSQKDLAERRGCSKDMIYGLEKGKHRLTYDWMRKIADALGCRASDMLLEEDFDPRLDQLDKQVMTAFRSLSPDNRRRMIEIVRSAALALADAETDSPQPPPAPDRGGRDSNGPPARAAA